MKIIGEKSLVSVIKYCLDYIYFFLAGLSLLIALAFLFKAFNPDSEVLEFYFHREVSLSQMVREDQNPINIPEIFGMKISDIKATTRYNINHWQSISLAFLAYLYAMGFFLFVVGNFRKIFFSFKKSEIFVDENAKRITLIGYALVIAELVNFSLSIFFDLYQISINLLSSTITADFNASIFLLAIGLSLIVLGAVFRQGVLLDEEQKLTV
ncbi:MAG: DUF2975 domain-containing protein [Candidatus Marinimicrobia bacterium]|nr:DUF2975 domain-containing protein [Candidatus Neomarinimicrobiota bacterium]